MISQPTPVRLQTAKAAAVAAAVVATTAALTAGTASQAPEALLAHKRSVQVEVELTAATPQLPQLPELPDIVGIYGVGPVFWAAQLLGLTPDNVIKAAAGMLGGTELATTVNGLLQVLDAVLPVEGGIKGPLPGDVYDAVNGLDYTGDGILKLLGLADIPLVKELIEGTPIVNQRRSVIFSESLGGLTTSLAYRDMIDAVQSDSDDWRVGVTGQWLIFFNNPSRPGGGLFALATPVTNLLGLNLSTPPAGSYTNEEANGGDITKVLNTSILDATWAYNILSDAPTTLNPLAWANAATGAVFLTYLLPSADNNIGDHVLPLLGAGILDGVKVMLDPTGGQGLAILGPILPGLLASPGTAAYITYDSGNLPLLEPFRMVPRLVNLMPGYHIPTPISDSFEDALRMMVNMGYQDVDPDTLDRGFDMAGEQAYLYDSPLTPTQQLAANKMVFKALIGGIQDNALDPDKWTPTIPGADLSPIFKNPLTEGMTTALSGALQAFQDAANPAFDAVETGLKPVTGALDQVDDQVTTALDGVFKVDEPTPDAAKPSNPPSPGPLSLSGIRSATDNLRTLKATTDEPETKPENTTRGGLKKITESFKAKPGKHAADAGDPVKKSVQQTLDKVSDKLHDTVGKVEKALKTDTKDKKDKKSKTRSPGKAA
ncbi:PE-PPE domain-containing protein [Mycobacterium sp. NPDC003449]